VGNAVSEAFMRELASGTGGECELVSPGEAIAERIVRQFERMRSPRAKEVNISWPGNAAEHYPSTFTTIFDGDTVVGFARFPDAGGSEPIVLEAKLETGEILHEELAVSSASFAESDGEDSIVARLVAHARLQEVGAEDRLQTALHYKLLSPWTNWIATVERPEGQKAFNIPGIRKVPQTVPVMCRMSLDFSVMMKSVPEGPLCCAVPWTPMATTHNRRLEHLIRFYSTLDALEKKLGGARSLTNCSGSMHWPARGVYFFREVGEMRSDTGRGPRIVRVGTHALKAGGGTKLWGRLSTHRGGLRSGGGNHRGSIFRLLVGTALISRDARLLPTWGEGDSADRAIRSAELELEQAVSQIIRQMPFLWLAIEDEPGPSSMRGRIEKNSIALLSNFNRPPLDPASANWLGYHCNRDRVKASGLWNQNHVDEEYDPSFLDELDELVAEVEQE
jgi:hypothetical protein